MSHGRKKQDHNRDPSEAGRSKAKAAGNKQLEQAIELAMSGAKGAEILAANVRNRLASFTKSRSMPSYEKDREIVAELDGLRTTIVETIGAENPGLAFDLLSSQPIPSTRIANRGLWKARDTRAVHKTAAKSASAQDRFLARLKVIAT